MFLETSAKTAFHVEEAFVDSSRMILENMERNKVVNEDTRGINIKEKKNDSTTNESRCC